MFKLLPALRELGASLPESAKTAPTDIFDVLAGLIYYLEHGTTEPPAPTVEPSVADQQNAEIESLKARLATAEANAAPPAPLPPSPVAPPPPAPAPEPAPGDTGAAPIPPTA